MSKFSLSSVCVFFLFLSGTLYAQDEVLFLNGKVLKGVLDSKTAYEYTFTTEKGKQFVIDQSRVFSYMQNNTETIVYTYDTLSGNFLKVEQMKYFVTGEREAHKTYRPVVSNGIGLAFGGLAGYQMHKESSFIYIGAPLIYTLGTLLFPTRVHQKRLTDTQYLNEEEYLRGYERVARSKRTQGALKSSILGMGVGFLISFIANK